jgi:SAM-dependent methyltransferase
MDAAPLCPICGTLAPEIVRTFTLDEVALHFVPASRDGQRHGELRDLLRRIWNGRATGEIRRCPACSFGFAEPYADGTERFYNLVTAEDPHYPRERWEFRRTLESLTQIVERSPNRSRRGLLEVGAGAGSFLKLLQSSSIGDAFVATAVEYDRGALAKLAQAGFQTHSIPLQALAQKLKPESFTVICLFQTLEHIADVQGLFRAIARLLRSDGHVFISVPASEAIEAQEELTGYLDLPPNHVGRWTRSAFEAISEQHALRVVEWEVEPARVPMLAWRLALSSVHARAYDEKSLPGRVNALRNRWLRGPAKRALALAYLPRMLAAWRRLAPPTQWVHIVRPA